MASSTSKFQSTLDVSVQDDGPHSPSGPYSTPPVFRDTFHNGFISYSDVIMCAKASKITGVSIVHSIVCSGTD